MSGCRKSIRSKIIGLLLVMTAVSTMLSGSISLWGLKSMKQLSLDNSYHLGRNAAEDTETALENLAVQNLQTVAEERAAYIEERFREVEAYVHGIAELARDIYAHPEKYPDRKVPLPVREEHILAPQLLWSQRLSQDTGVVPACTEEILKLGNVQDLLVQYNANNVMVSSVYLATESGWLIQADYIGDSKYTGKNLLPDYYEAAERQWYQRAVGAGDGQVIYSDVLNDFHEGGTCIVCAEAVFVNGKPAAVAGAGSYLDTINEVVLHTTIGESGYAFLIGPQGQILVSPQKEGDTAAVAENAADLRQSENEELAEMVSKVLAGKSGTKKMILDEKEVYLAYVPLIGQNWGFVTVMDVEEVIAPAEQSQNRILLLTDSVSDEQNQMMHQILCLFLLITGVVFVFICLVGIAFSGRLTAPVYRLTEEVTKIGEGNLACRIQLKTGDEVEKLGNAFNRMAAQLQKYVENLAVVTAEKERIRTEIDVASRLQADMLPKAEEMNGGSRNFILAASMTPAKGVGGDFYDFFLLDSDRLVIVIADVSGKGVPAALFMVVSRMVIKSRLKHMEKEKNALAKAVEEINSILCAENPNEMFVTAFIGILTLSVGKLEFVNAGHCHPLIGHKKRECEYIHYPGNFVLAGMTGTVYRQNRIMLQKEDTLLLYTDGVTEATSIAKKMYGEKRLKETAEMCSSIGQKPEEILETIWKDVEKFQEGAEQFDDITMLAVMWMGKGEVRKCGKPDKKNMDDFSAFIEEYLKADVISEKSIRKTELAADEILSNICHYSKASELVVSIRTGKNSRGKKILISFEDNGIPFNPLERQNPDVTEALEKRKEGGLGIYLVKAQMDEVAYEYRNNKNLLIIEKQDNG